LNGLIVVHSHKFTIVFDGTKGGFAVVSVDDIFEGILFSLVFSFAYFVVSHAFASSASCRHGLYTFFSQSLIAGSPFAPSSTR
jgi:hypothetical protein